MTYRILGSVVLFIALSGEVFSQDSSQVRPNSLQADKWALQFQISSNFTLASFEGATISIKKQSSPSAAVRLGMTVGTSVSSNDNTTALLDSSTRLQTTDANSENLSLQFHWICYPKPSSDVNLYFGIGPTASYSRNHSDSKVIRVRPNRPDSLLSSGTSTFISWGIGLNGLVGAEWFATRSISILAEYSTSATFSKSDNGATSTKQFSISSPSVRFGLSAYF